MFTNNRNMVIDTVADIFLILEVIFLIKVDVTPIQMRTLTVVGGRPSKNSLLKANSHY